MLLEIELVAKGVTPAKAGVQVVNKLFKMRVDSLDSGFHRNDDKVLVMSI